MTDTIHPLIIIGSGPAGYAAALYAARAQLKPLVFAGEQSGGQLMLTTKIENYPGFPDGILGPELMLNMRAQAERFGATIIDAFTEGLNTTRQPFTLTSKGQTYQARAVIIATGAKAKMMGIPGETEYLGRGVSTCAVCDAAFFRDKKVYVVGGGDAAMEDALALTKFTSDITLIHRRDAFRASKIMQQRVLEENADKVKVLWDSQVVKVLGDAQKINQLVVKNLKTNSEDTLPAQGLFIAIGHEPATGFLKDVIELDPKGYILTRLGLSQAGLKLAGDHLDSNGLVEFPMMTSVEGIFAGGDCVDFHYQQAVTAAGQGVQAALDAEWWLERVKGH